MLTTSIIGLLTGLAVVSLIGILSAYGAAHAASSRRSKRREEPVAVRAMLVMNPTSGQEAMKRTENLGVHGDAAFPSQGQRNSSDAGAKLASGA
jgi:hypothetical protein